MKKTLTIIIILVILGGGFYFYQNSRLDKEEEVVTPSEQTDKPIAITSEEIREENFTGSKPVIAGESKLAIAARTHVDKSLVEFKKQADIDVPMLREDFGADTPSASYTIEIGATSVESENTRSVIITEYVYTGGAHGSSSFKVLTASRQTGELLALSDIIKSGQETAFTALVKEKLLAWRPSGADGPVVFPEEVLNLTFNSFINWSLEEDKLILYFSQYEVGPGVLGAFAFPIPTVELKNILK